MFMEVIHQTPSPLKGEGSLLSMQKSEESLFVITRSKTKLQKPEIMCYHLQPKGAFA